MEGTTSYGLIDSGNTWRSAMSVDAFYALGYGLEDIKPLPQKEVGTALEGASLKVIGEPRRPLRFRVRGCETLFKFIPVLLEGLAMDINISGPWMQAHSWDHLHSKGCLKIQGHLVPLLKKARNTSRRSYAYLAKSLVVPPNSWAKIPLRVNGIEKHATPWGQGLIEGSERFMNATDLHPTVGALVQTDATGKTYAAVLNTTTRGIPLKQGQSYGTYKSLSSPRNPKPELAVVEKANEDRYRENIIRKAKRLQPKQARVDPGTPGEAKTRAEKMEWLVWRFKLNTSPFLDTEEKVSRAARVLLEFWDTFSMDGSYGSTDLVQHRIITDPGVYPIKERYRPIHPGLEDSLKEQIDAWLKHEVIEPADSPWSFNLVPVKKKNGKIRWCVDWRKLVSVLAPANTRPALCAERLRRCQKATLREKIVSPLPARGREGHEQKAQGRRPS